MKPSEGMPEAEPAEVRFSIQEWSTAVMGLLVVFAGAGASLVLAYLMIARQDTSGRLEAMGERVPRASGAVQAAGRSPLPRRAVGAGRVRTPFHRPYHGGDDRPGNPPHQTRLARATGERKTVSPGKARPALARRDSPTSRPATLAAADRARLPQPRTMHLSLRTAQAEGKALSVPLSARCEVAERELRCDTPAGWRATLTISFTVHTEPDPQPVIAVQPVVEEHEALWEVSLMDAVASLRRLPPLFEPRSVIGPPTLPPDPPAAILFWESADDQGESVPALEDDEASTACEEVRSQACEE